MSTEDARKLFVAGLPDSISEDVLRQLFEATGGNVVDVSIPRDRATGRPRGFGFVTLATTEEATAARDALDGSVQAGKSISVRPFQAEPPRRSDAPRPGPVVGSPSGGPLAGGDRTLYVGNLPYDATEEELNAIIAATGAGEVARVNLPIDPDGRKRGFGFVTMGSVEAARAALDALNGAEMRGRRLIVNIAHPKGEGPPRRDGPRPGPRPGLGHGYAGASNDMPEFRPMQPPDFGPPPDPARREERRRAAFRPEPERTTEGKGAKKRRGSATKERGRRGGGGGGRWQEYDDDDE
jgi:RNA recognition motif-containing protein